MFTPKANSKQKHAKMTQETRNRRYYYRATRCGEQSTRHGEFPHAALDPKSPWRVVTELNHYALGKTPFLPQNPNFDSPMPKLVPKVCSNVYRHKKTLKTI